VNYDSGGGGGGGLSDGSGGEAVEEVYYQSTASWQRRTTKREKSLFSPANSPSWYVQESPSGAGKQPARVYVQLFSFPAELIPEESTDGGGHKKISSEVAKPKPAHRRKASLH